MIGKELSWDRSLTRLQRWYCHLLGAPIVGLRIRWRRLSQLLPARAVNVLDAGCGRGIITRALASRYPDAQVLGVDTDPQLTERNQNISAESGYRNCRFALGDLLDFQQTAAFDLIVSVDNLEHVQDDGKVLRNLYESLTTDGTLVVHVPHYYRRWPIFQRKVNFDVPGHVRPGYHLAELRTRLEQAGFRVDDIGFSYGFLENLANNISYAITGAEERNRIIYALAFPLLNAAAWLGQWSRPDFGAGAWVTAHRRG